MSVRYVHTQAQVLAELERAGLAMSRLVCRLRSQDGRTRNFEEFFRRFQDETRRFRWSFKNLPTKSDAGRDARYNWFVTGKVLNRYQSDGLPVTSYDADALGEQYTIRTLEDCHRNIAFQCIIVAIPVTVIWATLNWFVSSVLDLGLEIGREFFKQILDGRFLFSRPLWPRRDETTSKNLDRLFDWCRVTDGRLPTLL